jgi:hypothetical protein
MIGRAAAVAALLLSFTPAAAGPDSDVVRRFGLIGTWAVDCSRPPSDDNTYEDYAPSEAGYPTRTWYRKQSDRNRPAQSFEMRNAHIVESGRLAYLDIRKSDGDPTNVVTEMVNGRHRSYASVDPNDGKVYIKDGKFVGTGKPTALFQKCPGR